jgi:hypothetical protein
MAHSDAAPRRNHSGRHDESCLDRGVARQEGIRSFEQHPQAHRAQEHAGDGIERPRHPGAF